MGEAKITDAGNLVSYFKVAPNTPNNAFAVRAIILSPRVSIAAVSQWETLPWLSRLGAKLVDATHKDPKLVLVRSGQDGFGFNYKPPCQWTSNS